MDLVIASGHFNPLHGGHISYLNAGKKLGDKLLVIVASDYQVRLKGSPEFLDEDEREIIVEALRAVDYTMISTSKDASCSVDFYNIRKEYPLYRLVYVKGGDRTIDNIPESEIIACKENNIEMIFNVGGSKIQSSSKILDKLYRR
jgi:cytidyltransferase-like protein